ncbi:MAG: tRNA-dihydrouridine synthase, partial [Clostridia bacterium]|nr:tRNA-dihydrouridine synthase [Clostridia bacterium]
VEFARMAYESGADGLCIHGRTSRQLYRGTADPEIMAQVVSAVPIPVMVNGDIVDRASADRLLSLTGAKFALVGRGALGNPWVFEPTVREISIRERLSEYLRQTEMAAAQKGERRALLESRAHISQYLTGFRGAAGYRSQAVSVCTLEDARALVEKILSEIETADKTN